jgi:hypothetical protein
VKIVVLAQAKEDIFDGYVFYERQQTGIGDYYIESIKRLLQRMKRGE